MGGDLGGRGAGHQPALLFGLRLWASVCLALFVAFWLPLNNPFWAGTSGRAVWELLCSAATPSLELSRWVISVISNRGTYVRYYPKSDRDCDWPGGR